MSAPAAELMPADQSMALAEFARACKSATRSVSLYPGTHPAIAAALSRVTSTAKRLTASGDLALGVHPEMLVVEGRVASRPDAAIGGEPFRGPGDAGERCRNCGMGARV